MGSGASKDLHQQGQQGHHPPSSSYDPHQRSHSYSSQQLHAYSQGQQQHQQQQQYQKAARQNSVPTRRPPPDKLHEASRPVYDERRGSQPASQRSPLAASASGSGVASGSASASASASASGSSGGSSRSPVPAHGSVPTSASTAAAAAAAAATATAAVPSTTHSHNNHNAHHSTALPGDAAVASAASTLADEELREGDQDQDGVGDESSHDPQGDGKAGDADPSQRPGSGHTSTTHSFDAKYEDDLPVLARRSSRAPSLPRIDEAAQKQMPLKQHHQDEAFNRAETSMARKLSIKRTSTENLAARAKTPVAPPPSASANLTVGSQQGVLGQRAMTPNSYYEMEEAQYRPQKFDKEKFKRANKEKNQEPGHAAQDVSRTDQLASAAAFRLELHAAAPLEASAAKPVYLDETDEDLMNEILGTA